MPYTMDIQNVEIRNKMNYNFNLFFQKNKQIINKEKLDENVDLTAKNEELESSFGVPLLICANKMDTLESFKDDRMVEHLQYQLRNFALKYGSSLIYTSTTPPTNILKLAEYLSFVLLGKDSPNLNV
jgi:hypothetical protein